MIHIVLDKVVLIIPKGFIQICICIGIIWSIKSRIRICRTIIGNAISILPAIESIGRFCICGRSGCCCTAIGIVTYCIYTTVRVGSKRLCRLVCHCKITHCAAGSSVTVKYNGIISYPMSVKCLRRSYFNRSGRFYFCATRILSIPSGKRIICTCRSGPSACSCAIRCIICNRRSACSNTSAIGIKHYSIRFRSKISSNCLLSRIT